MDLSNQKIVSVKYTQYKKDISSMSLEELELEEKEREETRKYLELTLEEEKELDERPISDKYTAFTEDQFIIRKQIASKICTKILEMSKQEKIYMSQKYIDIYKKFPYSNFYTTKDGSAIFRCYDIYLPPDRSNAYGLHIASCAKLFVHLIEYVNVDQLVPVDRWTFEQTERIKNNRNPGIFCDPLGFSIAIT